MYDVMFLYSRNHIMVSKNNHTSEWRILLGIWELSWPNDLEINVYIYIGH